MESNAVWGASPNEVWIAGAFGRLHHWDGTSWAMALTSITTIPDTEHLYGIWGRGAVDPDDVWVVGDGIALHKQKVSTDDGGAP